MDMNYYEFKNNNIVFKLLYYVAALTIVNPVIMLLNGETSVRVTIYMAILYVGVMIVIFRTTRRRVYIGDTRMETSKIVQYILISKITATTDIQITYGNKVTIIKIIDLENNYDKYKEVLDIILSKIDKNAADKSASAEEILESIKNNRKKKIIPLKNGKPMLGGWLQVIIIYAYFGAISGVFMIPALIFIGEEFNISLIQYLIQTLIYVSIIFFISKRKKSVKYSLALLPLLNTIFSIDSIIKQLSLNLEFLPILFGTLRIIIAITSAVLLIKIYFEYINNFDRPKRTLIN